MFSTGNLFSGTRSKGTIKRKLPRQEKKIKFRTVLSGALAEYNDGFTIFREGSFSFKAGSRHLPLADLPFAPAEPIVQDKHRAGGKILPVQRAGKGYINRPVEKIAMKRKRHVILRRVNNVIAEILFDKRSRIVHRTLIGC